MALLNPGFETPGDAPGLAEHWTLLAYTAAERIAGFGPEPHRAWEDFERWVEFQFELEEGSVVLAFFDHLAEGVEDFNEGWDNDLYLFELPTGQVVVCPFGGGAVEDMEDGWLTFPFAWDWAEVTAEIGEFDGEDKEDFEEFWRNNESFIWSWAAASTQTALFDGSTQPVEDFENGWATANTI